MNHYDMNQLYYGMNQLHCEMNQGIITLVWIGLVEDLAELRRERQSVAEELALVKVTFVY